jgi:hypothetical protein
VATLPAASFDPILACLMPVRPEAQWFIFAALAGVGGSVLAFSFLTRIQGEATLIETVSRVRPPSIGGVSYSPLPLTYDSPFGVLPFTILGTLVILGFALFVAFGSTSYPKWIGDILFFLCLGHVGLQAWAWPAKHGRHGESLLRKLQGKE